MADTHWSRGFASISEIILPLIPPANLTSLCLRQKHRAMSTLRRYRKLHGLTLAELAERVGTTKATIWKYENGVTPPVSVAIAISRATGGGVLIADLVPSVFKAVREEVLRASS